MQHIDEAGLHEYLDRGAVDDATRAAAEHIATCAGCRAKLRLAESDRNAATNILRAAAPATRPMPAFETILQRPKFETLDTGFNTDLAAFNPGAQYKQSSIGMRGQAIAFAWAATIVMAIGAGWFASELYRETNEIAPIAANTGTDSTVPGRAGPVVPVMTSAPAESATKNPATNAVGAIASNKVAKPVDQIAQRSEAAPPPQAPFIPRDRTTARMAASDVSSSPDAILSTRMLSDSSWRAISGDSARKALGGTVVRLHSMKVAGYSESADTLPQRIRMRQVNATGDTIDIIQTRPKSLTQGPSNSFGKAPALLARVVVEGPTGRQYYETLKWSDDRLVTIIAKDMETIRALKEDLLAER